MAVALEVLVKPKGGKVLKAMSKYLFVECEKQFRFMGKSFLSKFRKGCRGEYVNKRTGRLIRSMKWLVGGRNMNTLFCQWSANTEYAALLHEGFPNRPVTEKQHANSIFHIPGVGWRRFKKETTSVTFLPRPFFTGEFKQLRPMALNYLRTGARMAAQRGRLAA